ncbi:MAG: hypothetical protein K2Q15_10065, partial [Burkholderiales bacterium]|nr:hypothetical protein [Burkholderiales bacterium]
KRAGFRRGLSERSEFRSRRSIIRSEGFRAGRGGLLCLLSWPFKKVSPRGDPAPKSTCRRH